MPVDEMTRGVSKWIWPLELPGRVLDARVQRACHALALRGITMPAPSTVAEFLELTRKSGVVDPPALEAAVSRTTATSGQEMSYLQPLFKLLSFN